MSKEALCYRRLGAGGVECFLCAHNCKIDSEKLGLCGVRQNRENTLYSLNYGEVIAKNIDPVEKKPLYHFLPGSSTLSIASVGCNFSCDFCQNWQISQADHAANIKDKAHRSRPQDVVDEACYLKAPSISYTYTEPTVYFEFAYECAQLAQAKGIRNIFVSNGFLSKEALVLAAPFLDAANIDLKSYNDDFYRSLCRGRLAPVLDTIALMKKLGVWVELTTLLIPGQNDSSSELSAMAKFIAAIDRAIPWHLSRFHPDFKRRDKATPARKLLEAYEIGKSAGLHYVYVGNLACDYGQDTCCIACNRVLVKRNGYSVEELYIEDGFCVYCKAPVAGVF